MRKLTLTNHVQSDTTVLENEFIDHYMAEANGEYVKVYLILLRHLNEPSGTLTISKIADLLDITEKDVIRACYAGKTTHLTKMVDTHFQNSDLMLFIHFKNCNWKPPFIVEVSKCFMYTVFLRQYRSNHFLCACLSDTSCDSDNFNIKLLSVISCKLL